MARHYKLGGLAVMLVTVMAVLKAVSQLLRVPSGYGIEDLLGWVDPSLIAELMRLWKAQFDSPLLSTWLPIIYLSVDTAVFVPVYGAFFVGAWRESRRMLMRHSSRYDTWAWWLTSIGAGLVATLVLVDLLENLAGLQRLGYAWVMVPAVLIALAVLRAMAQLIDPVWLRAVLSDLLPPTRWRRIGALVVLGLGPLAFIVWNLHSGAAGDVSLDDRLLAWCSTAHVLKDWLVIALVLGPLALLAWVQFGPHADPGEWAKIVEARSALADTVWRSRYVLAAVGVCFALLVGMAQGQDVVYAMVSHPWTRKLDGTREFDAWAWLSTIAVLAATAVSLWIVGFACWLWTRLGVQVSRRNEKRDGSASAQDGFARDWARAWGVAPAALIVWLTLAALPHAVLLPDKGPIVVLILFDVLVIAGAIAFVWNKDRLATQHNSRRPGGNLYYANLELPDLLRRSEGGDYKLFGWLTPVWLPVVALAFGLFFRALGLFAPAEWHLPTLTLPVVLCLVAFWLSLAGWISLYEHSESVPWLLFGLVWIGALGFFGAADNHRVPLGDNGVFNHPVAAFAMAVLVGLWLVGALLLLLREMRRGTFEPTETAAAGNGRPPAPRQWVSWSLVVALVVLELGTMRFGDRVLGEHGGGVRAEAIEKPILAKEALAAWLEALCDSESVPASAPTSGKGVGGCESASARPVYVVASEGGGIRSAYWTALAMSEIAAQDAQFDQRTFAAAGVSGGALGLAVYRACRGRAVAASIDSHSHEAIDEMTKCVNQFGATDLLAPLVGAWFFEDALARWLPSWICSTPGCGFMSRGLWFEQAMSRSTVGPTDGKGGLMVGLLESRRRLVQESRRHTPYLLLNSTMVETGERVVASELLIDWKLFPGARDQAALLGHADIPLVTAAHNSSRFPFTNALGAVETFATRCSPDAYQQRGSAASGDRRHCGHLADGGIFDNGAGHSATDVLRLMRECLGDWTSDPSAAACPGLPRQKRIALAQSLKVKLLLIRNGTPFRHGEAVDESDKSAKRPRPAPCNPPVPLTADYLKPSDDRPAFDTLARPRCATNGALFIDAIGPIIAAFNAIGTGSNGRTALARAPTVAAGMEAMARQDGAAEKWQPAKIPGVEVVSIDLKDDGPLFPLGWHLSPSARALMQQRAASQAVAFKPKEQNQ